VKNATTQHIFEHTANASRGLSATAPARHVASMPTTPAPTISTSTTHTPTTRHSTTYDYDPTTTTIQQQGTTSVAYYTYDARSNSLASSSVAPSASITYTQAQATRLPSPRLRGVATTTHHTFTSEATQYTALYYYGYRFYDPELGRWVNRDPVGERGGINLYVAMVNATINMSDAMGQSASGPPRPFLSDLSTALRRPDLVGWCGVFSRAIKWNLHPRASDVNAIGYVVQEMYFSRTIWNCDGSIRKDADDHYWEAFRMQGGYDYTGGDHWNLPGGGACSRGVVKWFGDASYFHLWQPGMPPWQIDEDDDHPSNGLPYLDPPAPLLPSPSSDTVSRFLEISWDCCSGMEKTEVSHDLEF
jgi:RHS repeat-associated protein